MGIVRTGAAVDDVDDVAQLVVVLLVLLLDVGRWQIPELVAKVAELDTVVLLLVVCSW